MTVDSLIREDARNILEHHDIVFVTAAEDFTCERDKNKPRRFHFKPSEF